LSESWSPIKMYFFNSFCLLLLSIILYLLFP
jgi:hypothetical protein